MTKYTINPRGKTQHVSHARMRSRECFNKYLTFLYDFEISRASPEPASKTGPGAICPRGAIVARGAAFCHAAKGSEGGRPPPRLGAPKDFAVCPPLRGKKKNKEKKNHPQKYRSGWKSTAREMFPNYLGEKTKIDSCAAAFDFSANECDTSSPKSAR